MLALFNLGPAEVLVLGGCFLFILIPVVILAVVLPILLRRKRPIEADDASNPLDRAKDAAVTLTPAEYEELRRWLEERRPQPPRGSEGIQ